VTFGAATSEANRARWAARAGLVVNALQAVLRAFPPSRWLMRRLADSALTGRLLAIAPPYAWLLVFFLAPFAIVLKISFAEPEVAMPPYTEVFALIEDAGSFFLSIKLNVSNYILLIEDDFYLRAYLNSLKIAAISTALALLVGFPIAYAMARASKRWRGALVMMMILPFWTSFLIRVYAWIGILKNEGLLNGFLQWLGVIDQPLTILNTDYAVYIGIVYSYLPFMVLPLYATLEKMDESLLEAAADLGCRPIKAFWVITVPLAAPGIVAGAFLVFIPVVGEVVIPDLLGGSDTLMIGRTLWTEFFNNHDWPVASAVAMILLLILVIPIVLFQRHQAARQEASR
jgi:putrescine transport system permease protein